MGMDIYMSVIDIQGNYIKEDFFDGRCREWFEFLIGRGYYHNCNYIPSTSGIPDFAPQNIKDIYNDKEYTGCFGYNYISVEKFCDWFEKVRTDIDAGWVTTYEKWQYERKGVIPEEIYHFLDKEVNKDDYHFIEIETDFDCNKEVYEQVKSIKDKENTYIIYYFDW